MPNPSPTKKLPISEDIHCTIERSKAHREKAKLPDGRYGPVTAEHFHSFEYLFYLSARRQHETNEAIDRLTKVLVSLTVALFLLTGYLCYEAYLQEKSIQKTNEAKPKIALTKPDVKKQ